MDSPVARVGVLGGTFDPIHTGHLAVASEVCAELGLDQILLTPAYSQPFKLGYDAALPEHRLAMCELVAAEDERFAVSPVDIERGGITYTVDTLSDLREQRPDAELFFITGADALDRFEEWREPDRIAQLATLVGVTRPGHSLVHTERPHILVEVPALAISSTDVRRRVRAGRPIRYLVPRCVADYIAVNGLYYGGIDD